MGVGGPALKRRLVERVRTPVASFPTLVHPSAVVGRRVDLAELQDLGATGPVEDHGEHALRSCSQLPSPEATMAARYGHVHSLMISAVV